jgi:hypothetical protein
MGGLQGFQLNYSAGSETSAVLTNLRSNMTAVAGLAVLSTSATIGQPAVIVHSKNPHLRQPNL